MPDTPESTLGAEHLGQVGSFDDHTSLRTVLASCRSLLADCMVACCFACNPSSALATLHTTWSTPITHIAIQPPDHIAFVHLWSKTRRQKISGSKQQSDCGQCIPAPIICMLDIIPGIMPGIMYAPDIGIFCMPIGPLGLEPPMCTPSDWGHMCSCGMYDCPMCPPPATPIRLVTVLRRS